VIKNLTLLKMQWYWHLLKKTLYEYSIGLILFCTIFVFYDIVTKFLQGDNRVCVIISHDLRWIDRWRAAVPASTLMLKKITD